MKVHPIQTGTVRVKQFQLTGARNAFSRYYQLLFSNNWSEWLPIYCWLVEMNDQVLLVDTGETIKIYEDNYLPESGLYHKAVQTRIDITDDLPYKIQILGYKPTDISTVILTHLHGDHIGGIEHFPHADFYVSKREYKVATGKKGKGNGYFAKNWPSWFSPSLIEYENKPEGVFPQSYTMLRDKIILVPTPGHSKGHQSIIIKDSGKTYFIGGDLTYNLETLRAQIPNVIIPNRDAQTSVKLTHRYVQSSKSIFLSSHDWNAWQILRS